MLDNINLVCSIIRSVKPKIIFDTNSQDGWGPILMASAAKDAGSQIYVSEIMLEYFDILNQKINHWSLQDVVIPLLGDSADKRLYRRVVNNLIIDFAVIDDCGTDSIKIYRTMSEFLAQGAIVCVYGTNKNPVTSLRIFDYLSDPKIQSPVVDMVTFKAGNGLTIFTHP